MHTSKRIEFFQLLQTPLHEPLVSDNVDMAQFFTCDHAHALQGSIIVEFSTSLGIGTFKSAHRGTTPNELVAVKRMYRQHSNNAATEKSVVTRYASADEYAKTVEEANLLYRASSLMEFTYSAINRFLSKASTPPPFEIPQLHFAYGSLTNITIDDTDSTYWNFVGPWRAITPSTPCSVCLVQLQGNLTFNSTWHDGTLCSGSFVFQGSAVYIYGIDVENPANVTFTMSDPTVTDFHYVNTGSRSINVYNSLFFTATDLDATVEHTVSFLLVQSSLGGGAALFDYAIVTLDTPDSSVSASATSVPASATSVSASATSTAGKSTSSTKASPSPSPSKKSKTGTIVGVVVGVVVGLAILGAFITFFLRQRASRAGPRDMDIDRSYSNADGVPSGLMACTVEPYQPISFQPAASPRLPIPAVSPAAGQSHTAQIVSSSPDTADSKRPATVLAWDPNDPTGERAAREQDVQERVRRLEALVGASQPPSYHG
ncbi:hypothetical protein K438DRAFT_2015721 [Mycena galopus ATCC 62051]|nr:hypothetical protein K438DRAFT_2015721 [Mycena galopus ATCC 62051]